MTDLRHLLARLEAATGPDRELDREIDYLLWHPLQALHNPDSAPVFTSSIDASLALVEKKLPGHWWIVLNGAWHEIATPTDFNSRSAHYLTMFPRAILIALIRALISNQTDAKGGGG